jgi:uncharacterized protein YneF (UPF0154 family)
MKKWKAIVSIIIVFVLGVLAGALLTHKIYQHRVEGIMKGEPRTTREFIVQRLDRELHLDANQLEQVRAIVKETHTEMKKVRTQFRPQIEEILARSQEKIRALLRPDQREKYEKIIAERKKKREREENTKTDQKE